MSIALDRGQVEDLARCLAQVEDWLLHAGDHVHDDLADFAFHSCYQPRMAVGFLIEDLGGHAATLARALRDTDPTPPAPHRSRR